MTREQKKQKRISRAIERRKKRREIYVNRIREIRRIETSIYLPLSLISKSGYYLGASWDDPNSPTGRSQVCSYYGICQSPCNGDC
jgi:hypothetical protein